MCGQLRIILIVHAWAQWACGAAPHRSVATTQGMVRGYYAARPPHYAYRGVPYARPPTAYDRFKAPEPPPAWSGVFEATHRVRCPQPGGAGEENCLVVNVFAPEHAASLPVLVHFHAGGFRQGWGLHNSPRKLLEHGFVFVSFNYRLGVLGFLCLGLPDIPGNAGLKDQVAALYWVNRNIDKFGGNPSDVTAYGTGSGAVSIELLIFSGLTIDLFQKAILESGSALSPSAISHEPVLNAFNFAKDLGYKENIDRFNVVPEHFGNLLPNNLIFDSEKMRNKVASVVKDFYFDELGLNERIFQRYIAYVNDIFLEYPVIKSAAYHANNQIPVFLMKFLYKGRQRSSRHDSIPGAGFGDLHKYVVMNDILEDYDEIIAERLITMWLNFINLGDPTPLTTLLIPEVWQPLIPRVIDSKIVLQNIPCLMFGQTMNNVLLSSQQLVFWDRIYDKFYINSLD